MLYCIPACFTHIYICRGRGGRGERERDRERQTDRERERERRERECMPLDKLMQLFGDADTTFT
jgi:hypothetical protein